VWNLVGGGVDTTSSLTSLTLRHLDEHRDLRSRLVDRPELLPAATEEFLRYFAVSESLTRTVTRDVELCGQMLHRGDHVLISLLAANRDGTRFEHPDDVVVDRAPNPHLALGVGPHRCIGMHMARVMFRVLVHEVLARIPDYEIDHSATVLYDGNPNLHGVVRLPARFTPGPVVDTGEPPFGEAIRP
jgi:cytochrome P450